MMSPARILSSSTVRGRKPPRMMAMDRKRSSAQGLPSRIVTTFLLGSPCADDLFLSIAIILGGFLPLAVELDGICAGDIIDCLLFHVAVGRLHVAALVVILGGGVNVVGSVTHPVLPCEAPLNLVRLL